MNNRFSESCEMNRFDNGEIGNNTFKQIDTLDTVRDAR